MAPKVFADTNIIIDLIEQRPYDIAYINRLFESAENNEITLLISESIITQWVGKFFTIQSGMP